MTLRVAVVGAGAMGAKHARAVASAGDQVVLVVDKDHQRASRLAEAHGAQPRTDMSDLGEHGVEAAVVATPTADHPETTAHLLGKGIPVLVEKPHRTPSQPGWVAAAGEPRCWVGMSTRHLAGMATVADAIATGTLGEIVLWSDRIWYQLRSHALPGWYFDRDLAGGGILTTNGVHALDRVKWMLGDLRIESARLGRIFPNHETEDTASIAGTVGETRVEISLVWSSGPVPSSELIVVGTEGTAIVRQGQDWAIQSPGMVARGLETEIDDPLRRQWEAFREALASESEQGPTPQFLEGVMNQIESIYGESDL